MLYYNTIDPQTLELLKSLQAEDSLKDTFLVGGTALALQLGHRKSVDLDLFGNIQLTSFELREELSLNHTVTIIKESKNINIYQIDNVKVDVVNYIYPWIDAPVKDQGIILAGVKDITAMKIAAIIGRGTKKDFIDIYFLLKKFSLSEILDLYIQKYNVGSLFVALKSLSYFEDAQKDPMPVMLENADWDIVKETIRREVKDLSIKGF